MHLSLLTVCELAGVPIPDNLDGRSIVQLLKNPKAKWKHPAITMADPGDVNVRTEKWAYISYSTGDEELYDMTKDPMQWNNLASNPKYASIKKELAKHIPKHTAKSVLTKKSKKRD